MLIPYEDLSKVNERFNVSFQEAFSALLKQGEFILGDKLKSFESAFAIYCEREYCVGTGSGYDALFLAFKALDLPKGSKVLVSSITFVACYQAILNAGLIPKLVDVDLISYNSSLENFENQYDGDCSAILLVHLHGLVSEVGPIIQFAKSKGLKVIEDASHAHGAVLNGKKAGSFGDISIFSFYPTKILGALGDAGCILINDTSLYHKIKSLRNYGKIENEFKIQGLNSRMDEIQALFLTIKLGSIHEIIEKKLQHAQLYDSLLCDDVAKPIFALDRSHVYYSYAIRVKKRADLQTYLLEGGIGTTIHYDINTYRSFLSPFLDNKNENSEVLSSELLSLPISFGQSLNDTEKVIEVVNEFYFRNTK